MKLYSIQNYFGPIRIVLDWLNPFGRGSKGKIHLGKFIFGPVQNVSWPAQNDFHQWILNNFLKLVFGPIAKQGMTHVTQIVDADSDWDNNHYYVSFKQNLALSEIVDDFFSMFKIFHSGSLGWFKTPVSSQTHKLMAATKFSDYLGLKHYKKVEK
jgi:hypothetical protein